MTSQKILPKISIVTPSFNQAKYLEETIRSVISQNYPNLEYIIIDGDSSDSSQDIIKRYSDSLAYWVSEKDEGQSHAIEKGFSIATGDIFGWINSDDLLLPNALFLVAEHFLSNPTHHFVHGDCQLINENSDIFCNLDAPNGIRSMTWSLEDSLRNWPKYWFAQQSTFWTASLWRKSGGLNHNLHYAMDLELWHRFSKHCQLHKIHNNLAAYRIHSEAKCYHDFLPSILENMKISGKYGADDVRQFWNIYEPLIDSLIEQNKKLWDENNYYRHTIQQFEKSRLLKIRKKISNLTKAISNRFK
jgi:glycosyltransferase involved in cell wall biosynthesis